MLLRYVNINILFVLKLVALVLSVQSLRLVWFMSCLGWAGMAVPYNTTVEIALFYHHFNHLLGLRYYDTATVDHIRY